MPGLAGSIFLRKVSVHRWSVDRRRTYRGCGRCAPSGRVRKSGCRCRSHAYRKTEYDHSGGSRRRDDGGCYRSDGTDGTDGTDRLKSERIFPMLVSPVGRFLYSKFIRISNSCRRRFDIRVWRWGYCRIDGFGKTGKRVESAVKMCLSRPVALSRIGFYDKVSRENGRQNRFEDCSKKR